MYIPTLDLEKKAPLSIFGGMVMDMIWNIQDRKEKRKKTKTKEEEKQKTKK